ncbi:MAG: CopD family protein [Thermoflexales bacterium]|nr:CopD family protein [Thermoflexales bacterium]
MINLLEPPARAVLYIALMVMVGLPIGLYGVVLPIFHRHGISGQLILGTARRIQAIAALAMLAGATAFFIAQVVPLELEFGSLAEWVEFTRRSLLGQMWIARLVLGLIALAALKLVMSPTAGLVACASAGLAAQTTITLTGHSAAMGEGWMPVAADFAHLLAGALWGGGLVILWVAVHHVARSRTPQSAEMVRALIRRFSPFGIAGVALVAGTGVALSSLHVADADALRNSDYGRLILLKALLAVGAVAFAALHKFATQQQLKSHADVRRFSRTLLAELALVIGVFFGAALLSSTAPAHQYVTHQMPDGSTHTMPITDPDFQRALRIVALATLAVGAIACALEWRARLKTSSEVKV